MIQFTAVFAIGCGKRTRYQIRNVYENSTGRITEPVSVRFQSEARARSWAEQRGIELVDKLETW